MVLFYDDILNADNILIASPLYYSMLTGAVLNFVSRFQYFFVSENIRKDSDFFIKKRKDFAFNKAEELQKTALMLRKFLNLFLNRLTLLLRILLNMLTQILCL